MYFKMSIYLTIQMKIVWKIPSKLRATTIKISSLMSNLPPLNNL